MSDLSDLVLNIPRDKTLKNIADSVQAMAYAMAATNMENLTWKAVQNYVENGFASKYYQYGDQFAEKWNDTAASKEYDCPFHVSHFGEYRNENDDIFDGMAIQSHYAHPFGIPFSKRAFLKCPEGLAAGTYHLDFAASWGDNQDAKPGIAYSFTLTKPVPEGGSLYGFSQLPEVSYTNWKVTSYAADGKTVIEGPVSVKKSNDGTNLGTLQLTKRNENLNSMQEAAYGYNRWKYSALRQYLNSDKGKGEWWTKQDDWDIAPDELATKAGYLTGLSDELKSVMKTVKITTYTNTVCDDGSADITYDKVFLPSLEELYIVPQIKGEGSIHEYWKERSGATAPLAQHGTYTRMISYSMSDHNSAQYQRLRSANRGNACNTWRVNASGNVNYNNALWASAFLPIIVIGGKSK